MGAFDDAFQSALASYGKGASTQTPKMAAISNTFQPGQYAGINNSIAAQQLAKPIPQPKPTAPPKQSFLSRALTDVGHVGKSIGVSTNQGLIQPLYHATQKNIIQPFEQPTSTQADVNNIINSQTAAQKAVASGKVSPQTIKMVSQVQSAPAKIALYQAIANSKTNDQQVQQLAKTQIQKESANNKQGAGVALQLASLAAGAGETAGLTKGAELARGALINTAAGAAGNVGSQLTTKPNSSAKSLITSGVTGGLIGGGIGLAAGGIGALASKLTSKADPTIGALQNATQAKYLSDFEKAHNAGDIVTVQKIQAAHPTDTRLNIDTTSLPQSKSIAQDVSTPIKTSSVSAGKGSISAAAVGDGNTLTAQLIKSAGEKNSPKTVAKNATDVFSNAQLARKKTVISPIINPSSEIKNEIKNKFNPVAEYGKEGQAGASAFQSKLGQLSADLRPAKAASAERQAVFDKMTPQEHLQFINNMQHGVSQPTNALQRIADQYTTLNKQGAEVAKGVNPDFQAMDNYFTQSGIVSKGDASALAKKWMNKSNTPGSLKQRVFPSVQEAVQFANENHVPLRETNPEKLFMNNHQAVLTAGRLKEFTTEQAARGRDPAIPQKLIDRYSEKGLSGSAAYQAYRKGAGTINNIQLAGGFHYGKSALEKINGDISAVVNTALSGHPIAAAKLGAKEVGQELTGFGYRKGSSLAKDVANGVDNHMTQAVKLANFNTAPDARYAVNGIKKSLEDITSGHVIKGTVTAPLRLINTGMKPLMNKWVPNLKNAAFMNLVDAADATLGKDATAAERALAYQKAGNTVDGIMGQMNQDNLFWSKTTKDALAIGMRSPGYNIGTAQQIGGGLKDLLQAHPFKALEAAKSEGIGAGAKAVLPESIQSLISGKGLSTRSAYTVAMTANTAVLGAVATYLFTGHGPKSPIDYFYPPTGRTDKNGNPERISLPSYAKDIFSFAHNPGQTLANKSSPLLSTGLQVASNKDYFGNMVRNPQDSLKTQLSQTGKYLGKQALPFSVSNSSQRVDKGAGTKVQSFFGLNPAPGYITKSPFEQKVGGALNQALGSKALTPEEQAVVQSKSEAKQAVKAGDLSKLDALVKNGTLTQKQGDNLKLAAAQTSLGNSFSYLLKVDRPAAARIINQASPQDIAKLGDINKLISSLNKTQYNKGAKQSTKDASRQLVQALNKYKK